MPEVAQYSSSKSALAMGSGSSRPEPMAASRGPTAASSRAPEPMPEDSRTRDGRPSTRSPARHSSRLPRAESYDEPARRSETRYRDNNDRYVERERDWHYSSRKDSIDRGYARERELSPRPRLADYRDSSFRRPSWDSAGGGRSTHVGSPDRSPSQSRGSTGQYASPYADYHRRSYAESSGRDRESYSAGGGAYSNSVTWRRQSAASDMNSIHSQEDTGNVVETVTYKGVDNVPTGPKIASTFIPGSVPTSIIDLSSPHIMIPTQNWSSEAAPHFTPHLTNMLRKHMPSMPSQIELTKAGFFLGFDDSAIGRSILQSCYNKFDGKKLFGKHALEMERFPSGRASRQSRIPDASEGHTNPADSTTNGHISPIGSHSKLSKQFGLGQHDPAASELQMSVNPSSRPSNIGQEVAQDPRDSVQIPVTLPDGGHPREASLPLNQSSIVRQDTDDTSSSVSGITGRSDGSSSKRPQCHVCSKGNPEDPTDLVRCSCGRRYHRRCHRKPPIPAEVGEDWKCRRCAKEPRDTKRGYFDKRRSSLSSELFVSESSDHVKESGTTSRPQRSAKTGATASAAGGEKVSSDTLQVPHHSLRGTRNSRTSSPQRSDERQAASSDEYDPFQDSLHGIATDGTSPSTGATPEPPRTRASKSPAHSITRLRKAASQVSNGATDPRLRATSHADVNGSDSTSNVRSAVSHDKQNVNPQAAQSLDGSREIPESPIETRNGIASSALDRPHLHHQSRNGLAPTPNGDDTAHCRRCEDRVDPKAVGDLCSTCEADMNSEKVDGAVIDETTITATQESGGFTSTGPLASQRSTRSTDPRLRRNPRQKPVRDLGITSHPRSNMSPKTSQVASTSEAALNGHTDDNVLSSDYTTAAELQASAAEQDGRIHRYSEDMAPTSTSSKPKRSPKKVVASNGRTTRRRKKVIREDFDEDDEADAAAAARHDSDHAQDEDEDMLDPDADEADVPSDSALSSVAEISEIDPTLEVPQMHKKRRRLAGVSQIRDAVDEFDLGNWRERPKGTYVKLICMALHAKHNHTMTPKEAVQWISDNIPDYPTNAGDWTKNIGATLASRRVGSEPMGKKAGLWRRDPAEPVNSTETVWYILLPEVVDIIPRWDVDKQQPFFPVGPETPIRASIRGMISLPKSKKTHKRKASVSLSPGTRRGFGRVRRKAKSAARVFDSEDDAMDGVETLEVLPPKNARRKESDLVDDEDDTKSPSGYATRRKKRDAVSAALQAVVGANAEIETVATELDAMDLDPTGPLSRSSAAAPPPVRVLSEPILLTNDPRLVMRDPKSLALQIRHEAMTVECRETSLFDAWPETDPSRAFDAEAKIADIKKRPNWKARKGLPSHLDDWMRKPLLPSKPREKSAHSARSTGWDDTVGHVYDFKTSEDFFDLPNQPEPFLHEKELAWRDGTVKRDGKSRRPIIYRPGYAP